LQQSPNLEADSFLANRAVCLILWKKAFYCLVRSTLLLLSVSSHITWTLCLPIYCALRMDKNNAKTLS
jgi:hypothetical protein